MSFEDSQKFLEKVAQSLNITPMEAAMMGQVSSLCGRLLVEETKTKVSLYDMEKITQILVEYFEPAETAKGEDLPALISRQLPRVVRLAIQQGLLEQKGMKFTLTSSGQTVGREHVRITSKQDFKLVEQAEQEFKKKASPLLEGIKKLVPYFSKILSQTPGKEFISLRKMFLSLEGQVRLAIGLGKLAASENFFQTVPEVVAVFGSLSKNLNFLQFALEAEEQNPFTQITREGIIKIQEEMCQKYSLLLDKQTRENIEFLTDDSTRALKSLGELEVTSTGVYHLSMEARRAGMMWKNYCDAEMGKIPVLNLPAEPPKCDFCSDGKPTWTYPAKDFEVTVCGVQFSSSEGWAACDVCHLLIEESRLDELFDRSVETFPNKETPLWMIKESVRILHGEFFEHREGPPIREEKDGSNKKEGS